MRRLYAVHISARACTKSASSTNSTTRSAASRAIHPRLRGAYEQNYDAGLISERRGKALLFQDQPGVGPIACECLHDAMHRYEKAQSMHPRGNDDAVLRDNTCARLIANFRLEPQADERHDDPLE